MDEREEYDALRKELDELASVTIGVFTPGKLARMGAQATLLLYLSNIRLADSSERLAKRNLWLTRAIFAIALMQLAGLGFQIWLSVRYPATVITMPNSPVPPQPPK